MASEIEELATRLNEVLGGGQSLHKLQQSLRAELRPAEGAGEEYPTMWYFRGDRLRNRVINSQEEQAQAAAEGFVREPLPPSEPRYFVERPRSLGGSSYDLRRVILFSAEEEAQFHAATEDGAWIEDDVRNVHGARGVALSDVIAERKAQLKTMIDQNPLELAADEEGEHS